MSRADSLTCRECPARANIRDGSALSVALAAFLVLLGLAAPVSGAPADTAPVGGATGPDRTPLPVGTDWDYQLGGPRGVPDRVGIVLRDRSARPIRERYNICYVNAFQTQPDEGRFWRARPSLILRKNGRPVVDSAWGEKLLDIRTPTKRHRLARIVAGWMRGCARDGFDAAELDNLDSFARSRGLLKPRHARAFARLLTTRGHRAGLSVAQKNWPGLAGRRIGFDFAVAEECARWRECGSYRAHFGRRVLAVEYRPVDFRRACRTQGARIAVVRRDLALRPNGARAWCKRP